MEIKKQLKQTFIIFFYIKQNEKALTMRHIIISSFI